MEEVVRVFIDFDEDGNPTVRGMHLEYKTVHLYLPIAFAAALAWICCVSPSDMFPYLPPSHYSCLSLLHWLLLPHVSSPPSLLSKEVAKKLIQQQLIEDQGRPGCNIAGKVRVRVKVSGSS